MDNPQEDLVKLDSERSDEPCEHSQVSNISHFEQKARKTLYDVSAAEDEHRDLLYSIFNLGILTEPDTKKIRICHERLVNRIRRAILNPLLEEKKELMKAKLRAYCEEFIQIVDERVLPFYWVSVFVKGNLLRMKADFLRYLFEIHPENGIYQVRAHNAYTEAKAFFAEHRMNKSLEWCRLKLNYATLLYLDGFPTAAMFSCQQLLKSAKSKVYDARFERRVRKNVDFFKRNALS
ncbi:hypothetical protein X801_07034 [Opisthorchis viverrini]|uniref:Uncharacterized protein n=2 Tax=Opisthorchis viverrini TaxID=6198 RepID=A0A1S8WS30_OPIVI|nr:hypothetical protein T265_06038 [Opisthorchis viverrini]KER26755.1 hypothetical protein T265_06038 [Opisthorchis viverrini]OON17134.1 hypothetical protein X801_07034 [Opisthorchis viverrini]